jgi:hypothetical protein
MTLFDIGYAALDATLHRLYYEHAFRAIKPPEASRREI